MPTVLELAGAKLPEGHQLDGVSLVPLLREGKPLGRRQLFWNGKAVRDGQWKLVVGGRGAKGVGLYDLSTDIGETTDLADRHPDRVEEMLAALDAWKRDVAATATPQPPPPAGIATGARRKKVR